ncbi:hypothetical protein BGX28_002602, partial [Mortierella sp. GBA30]
MRRLGDVARAAETRTAAPAPTVTINPSLEPTTAYSLAELPDASVSDSEAEADHEDETGLDGRARYLPPDMIEGSIPD